MHKLIAFTQIKNEAPYLAEWVAFHLMQGFEHFYFYDNGSTDDFENELAPYRDVVTFIKIPDELRNKQSGFWTIRHAFANLRCKWAWVASIDEYMFCPPGGRVFDLLDDYDEFASLGIQWQLYNSSGAEKKETGLVIERFFQVYDESPLHLKSIVKPDLVAGFADPHFFLPKPGFKAVNEKKEPIFSAHPPVFTAEKIRINHYHTMSREEYVVKMSKGRSDIAGHEDRFRENWEAFWQHAHSQPPKFDFSLFPYIGPLKEAMIKRKLGHKGR